MRLIAALPCMGLRFTVDGDELDAGPGSWLHMAAQAPHALVATEPTVMLLTLLRP